MKRPIVLLNLTMSAVPLLLLAACSSSYDYYTLPIMDSPRSSPAPTNVWAPDRITAYSVGRTVDPRDPNLVHEAHTVYRREESSHPDLAPPFATATPPVAPAASPAITNINTILRDVLTAEVNQQRAASQALVQEARALNERLRELNSRSQDVRNSVEDSARLRAQLQAVINRLDVIENQLRPGPAAPAAQTPTNQPVTQP